MIQSKLYKGSYLVLGLATLLTACGGSGGGSSSSVAPPAPIPNTAPSVTLSDVPAEVREGDSLSFSFAGTDAEGDALTYTLSTIAGPDLGLSVSGTAGSGMAPSVDADMTATIQVRVSDGRLSGTATADVVIINNAPPVAMLSATPLTVDEGQPITFDASASNDSEGDTLTYSYVQIAGPELNLESAAESFTVAAPEVTADSVVTLEVQVSDGRDTSTERVDVNVTNVEQMPKLQVTIDIERSLSIEGELFGIAGFVNPNDMGLLAVTDIDGGLVGLRSIEVGSDTEFDEGVNQLVTPQFQRGSRPRETVLSDTFLIIESDGVTVLQQDASNADAVLNVAGKLDVEEPCTAELTIQRSSAGSFLIIGRKGGVSLYAYNRGSESLFDFDTLALLDSVDDGNDYCALSTGGSTNFSDGGGSTPGFFLGFDSDSFDIQRFEITDDGAGGITLEMERRFANPDLPVDNRSFVRGFRRPGFFNTLGVIVADEYREGNHSIQYIIERPNSDDIGVFTGNWTLGKPTDLTFVEFDDEITVNPDGSTTSSTGDVYMFITTPDTPQSVAFREPENRNVANGPLEVSYLEVGLGASIAYGTRSAANDTSDNGFDGLILGYPEKREIKRFDTSDVVE
ncbi:Ig-like domain-containing protein [Hellea balneolensis]|uniref:Ig-like domain-containing protein n=1 Tax=Hellea balneolensis TaxID=287478 RepID=UPI00042507D3|nr:PKD domain-containing protein [Hellea balneolensis]